MSKTTVTDITENIKSLADYSIVDSDLDALVLTAINLAIKRMKQWFLNEGMYLDIGAHDTFPTVANQAYVEIATTTIDFDVAVVLTERDNDTPIPIIDYKEFRERYVDPTANASDTPDVAAFFANRLYLGPTPASVFTLYLDYVKLLTKLISTGTLPYEDKYDELVIAIVMEYLVKWMDRKNINGIRSAKLDVLELKHELIVGAVNKIGVNQQTQSRKGDIPYFAPRRVIT